jgi:hypothetical protein
MIHKGADFGRQGIRRPGFGGYRQYMLFIRYGFQATLSEKNFFDIFFDFVMIPTQIDNPKPSYWFLREKSIVAVYYPFIFINYSQSMDQYRTGTSQGEPENVD